MTYIIGEACIDVKDISCQSVCPVDCIHETDRMLVIDAEECIDCGACEPECPVEAILPEDAIPHDWEPFVKINYAFNQGIPVVEKLVEEYAEEHRHRPRPAGRVSEELLHGLPRRRGPALPRRRRRLGRRSRRLPGSSRAARA